MLRRDFIKTLAAAGLCAGQPWINRSAQAAPLASYDGKFFVSISADGGWDVPSLCDPKANSSINDCVLAENHHSKQEVDKKIIT